MNYETLSTYPASRHREAPDRDFQSGLERWELALLMIPATLGILAILFVGAILLLWWLLTAQPVDSLLGLTGPELVGLLLSAGAGAFALLVVLVRKSHVDEVCDYEDR